MRSATDAAELRSGSDLHPADDDHEPMVSTGRDLDVIVLVVGGLAAVFGALERLWLLFHLPLFGDEAVVGLMARTIDSGHFTTFYWGQHYGGLEPYVAAMVAHAVGGPIGLNATAALLSGLSAVLVGLVVAEVSGGHRTGVRAGVLAGALAWVWPYALVWNSSRELGFHFVTVTLGLALFYGAVRIGHGHRRGANYLLVGVCAGAGWWASPEIVYFAVPTAVVLVGSWYRWSNPNRRPLDPWPGALLVAGFAIGALPWIYTNATTGFASLAPSSAPSTATTYGGRLVIFFHHVLPTELGLRYLFSGAWVGGAGWGRIAYAVALAGLAGAGLVAARALRGEGAGLALFACGVSVVVFPFVFAADPGAGYWLDGRYGTDLSFLIAILVVAALAELCAPRSEDRRSPGAGRTAPRRGAPTSAAATAARPAAARVLVAVGVMAVVVGAALTAVASHTTSATPDTSATAFLGGWQNPNRAMDDAARAMDAHGIRFAYADYWTAYDLDYVDPSITVSPTPLDPVRSDTIATAVARAHRPAWLFFAPDRLPQALKAFSSPEQGPGTVTEDSFLALLAQRRIPSTVVHLGVLDAVVPDRRVPLP